MLYIQYPLLGATLVVAIFLFCIFIFVKNVFYTLDTDKENIPVNEEIPILAPSSKKIKFIPCSDTTYSERYYISGATRVKKDYVDADFRIIE